MLKIWKEEIEKPNASLPVRTESDTTALETLEDFIDDLQNGWRICVERHPTKEEDNDSDGTEST